MARLFISQDKLDDWCATDRAQFVGEVLSLDGKHFTIMAGVYFDKVAGDESDPHDLLGKVKDEEELATLGAEQYHNSVIYGDSAYDVVCGFVGVLTGG